MTGRQKGGLAGGQLTRRFPDSPPHMKTPGPATASFPQEVLFPDSIRTGGTRLSPRPRLALGTLLAGDQEPC